MTLKCLNNYALLHGNILNQSFTKKSSGDLTGEKQEREGGIKDPPPLPAGLQAARSTGQSQSSPLLNSD